MPQTNSAPRTKKIKTSKKSRAVSQQIYLAIIENKISQLQKFTQEQILSTRLTDVRASLSLYLIRAQVWMESVASSSRI